MNSIKKIIFLSNDEKEKGMGVIKFEYKNSNLFGNLKLYQFKFNGEYILAIKTNDQIIKQNIILKDNDQYSFIVQNKINIDNIKGCVLLSQINNDIKPLLWGNEKNQNLKNVIISELRENIRRLSNIHNDHIKTTNQATQKTNNLDEQLTLNIDKCLNNNNEFNHEDFNFSSIKEPAQNQANTSEDMVYSPIKNIKYPNESINQISLDPELFSDTNEEIAVASINASLFEDSEEEIQKNIDKELENLSVASNHKFYNMIADQLTEIFNRYPKENNLSKLINNSYWAKIDNDFDNKNYVVGIIRDDNDIKYICYGVPGRYDIEPPLEMREYSQWLPTDIKDPYTNGYWIMYQDADTGENIFIK